MNYTNFKSGVALKHYCNGITNVSKPEYKLKVSNSLIQKVINNYPFIKLVYYEISPTNNTYNVYLRDKEFLKFYRAAIHLRTELHEYHKVSHKAFTDLPFLTPSDNYYLEFCVNYSPTF